MSRTPILILAPEVVERIAAGEVVERPVSVVKELVENAVDAGATEISVQIEDGGRRLICVADNGCGIPADEVELAFHRHATSKLRSFADLFAIETLGFRGEALASIAAIADVTMVTASDDSGLATRIRLRSGSVVDRGHAARLRGTTISVRSLFEPVPARLKFLGTTRTELALISLLLRKFAVGYPQIRLSLQSESRLIFQSSGSGKPEIALGEAFGSPVAAVMVPIGPLEQSSPGPGFSISGFISGRTLTRPNRQSIATFVNRRWATSRGLTTAIEAAYRPFLPRGRHPILILHVGAAPSTVDVNVHPAKTEVRLELETAIGETVNEQIRMAIGREAVAMPDDRTLRFVPSWPKRNLHRLADGAEAWDGDEVAVPGGSLPRLRIVGQMDQRLILAEADRGLLLIDQHRAHERALYERLRARHEEPPVRTLSDPVLVELSPRQSSIFGDRLPQLAELGFEIEQFGGHTFLVRAVPNVGELPAESIDLLLGESTTADSNWRDRLLTAIACRSAIRKGQALALAQQRQLLIELAGTASPAVCPHGAPIILQVSRRFLDRQFAWA